MTAIVTPTPTATQSNGGGTVIDDAIAEIGAATDARSVELYAGRRLPDDLYRAVATAGLFRQLVPREFGGLEPRVSSPARRRSPASTR